MSHSDVKLHTLTRDPLTQWKRMIESNIECMQISQNLHVGRKSSRSAHFRSAKLCENGDCFQLLHVHDAEMEKGHEIYKISKDKDSVNEPVEQGNVYCHITGHDILNQQYDSRNKETGLMKLAVGNPEETRLENCGSTDLIALSVNVSDIRNLYNEDSIETNCCQNIMNNICNQKETKINLEETDGNFLNNSEAVYSSDRIIDGCPQLFTNDIVHDTCFSCNHVGTIESNDGNKNTKKKQTNNTGISSNESTAFSVYLKISALDEHKEVDEICKNEEDFTSEPTNIERTGEECIKHDNCFHSTRDFVDNGRSKLNTGKAGAHDLSNGAMKDVKRCLKIMEQASLGGAVNCANSSVHEYDDDYMKKRFEHTFNCGERIETNKHNIVEIPPICVNDGEFDSCCRDTNGRISDNILDINGTKEHAYICSEKAFNIPPQIDCLQDTVRHATYATNCMLSLCDSTTSAAFDEERNPANKGCITLTPCILKVEEPFTVFSKTHKNRCTPKSGSVNSVYDNTIMAISVNKTEAHNSVTDCCCGSTLARKNSVSLSRSACTLILCNIAHTSCRQKRPYQSSSLDNVEEDRKRSPKCVMNNIKQDVVNRIPYTKIHGTNSGHIYGEEMSCDHMKTRCLQNYKHASQKYLEQITGTVSQSPPSCREESVVEHAEVSSTPLKHLTRNPMTQWTRLVNENIEAVFKTKADEFDHTQYRGGDIETCILDKTTESLQRNQNLNTEKIKSGREVFATVKLWLEDCCFQKRQATESLEIKSGQKMCRISDINDSLNPLEQNNNIEYNKTGPNFFNMKCDSEVNNLNTNVLEESKLENSETVETDDWHWYSVNSGSIGCSYNQYNIESYCHEISAVYDKKDDGLLLDVKCGNVCENHETTTIQDIDVDSFPKSSSSWFNNTEFSVVYSLNNVHKAESIEANIDILNEQNIIFGEEYKEVTESESVSVNHEHENEDKCINIGDCIMSGFGISDKSEGECTDKDKHSLIINDSGSYDKTEMSTDDIRAQDTLTSEIVSVCVCSNTTVADNAVKGGDSCGNAFYDKCMTRHTFSSSKRVKSNVCDTTNILPGAIANEFDLCETDFDITDILDVHGTKEHSHIHGTNQFVTQHENDCQQDTFRNTSYTIDTRIPSCDIAASEIFDGRNPGKQETNSLIPSILGMIETSTNVSNDKQSKMNCLQHSGGVASLHDNATKGKNRDNEKEQKSVIGLRCGNIISKNSVCVSRSACLLNLSAFQHAVSRKNGLCQSTSAESLATGDACRSHTFCKKSVNMNTVDRKSDIEIRGANNWTSRMPKADCSAHVWKKGYDETDNHILLQCFEKTASDITESNNSVRKESKTVRVDNSNRIVKHLTRNPVTQWTRLVNANIEAVLNKKLDVVDDNKYGGRDFEPYVFGKSRSLQINQNVNIERIRAGNSDVSNVQFRQDDHCLETMYMKKSCEFRNGQKIDKIPEIIGSLNSQELNTACHKTDSSLLNQKHGDENIDADGKNVGMNVLQDIELADTGEWHWYSANCGSIGCSYNPDCIEPYLHDNEMNTAYDKKEAVVTLNENYDHIVNNQETVFVEVTDVNRSPKLSTSQTNNTSNDTRFYNDPVHETEYVETNKDTRKEQNSTIFMKECKEYSKDSRTSDAEVQGNKGDYFNNDNSTDEQNTDEVCAQNFYKRIIPDISECMKINAIFMKECKEYSKDTRTSDAEEQENKGDYFNNGNTTDGLNTGEVCAQDFSNRRVPGISECLKINAQAVLGGHVNRSDSFGNVCDDKYVEKRIQYISTSSERIHTNNLDTIQILQTDVNDTELDSCSKDTNFDINNMSDIYETRKHLYIHSENEFNMQFERNLHKDTVRNKTFKLETQVFSCDIITSGVSNEEKQSMKERITTLMPCTINIITEFTSGSDEKHKINCTQQSGCSVNLIDDIVTVTKCTDNKEEYNSGTNITYGGDLSKKNSIRISGSACALASPAFPYLVPKLNGLHQSISAENFITTDRHKTHKCQCKVRKQNRLSGITHSDIRDDVTGKSIGISRAELSGDGCRTRGLQDNTISSLQCLQQATANISQLQPLNSKESKGNSCRVHTEDSNGTLKHLTRNPMTQWTRLVNDNIEAVSKAKVNDIDHSKYGGGDCEACIFGKRKSYIFRDRFPEKACNESESTIQKMLVLKWAKSGTEGLHLSSDDVLTVKKDVKPGISNKCADFMESPLGGKVKSVASNVCHCGETKTIGCVCNVTDASLKDTLSDYSEFSNDGNTFAGLQFQQKEYLHVGKGCTEVVSSDIEYSSYDKVCQTRSEKYGSNEDDLLDCAATDNRVGCSEDTISSVPSVYCKYLNVNTVDDASFDDFGNQSDDLSCSENDEENMFYHSLGSLNISEKKNTVKAVKCTALVATETNIDEVHHNNGNSEVSLLNSYISDTGIRNPLASDECACAQTHHSVDCKQISVEQLSVSYDEHSIGSKTAALWNRATGCNVSGTEITVTTLNNTQDMFNSVPISDVKADVYSSADGIQDLKCENYHQETNTFQRPISSERADEKCQGESISQRQIQRKPFLNQWSSFSLTSPFWHSRRHPKILDVTIYVHKRIGHGKVSSRDKSIHQDIVFSASNTEYKENISSTDRSKDQYKVFSTDKSKDQKTIFSAQKSRDQDKISSINKRKGKDKISSTHKSKNHDTVSSTDKSKEHDISKTDAAIKVSTNYDRMSSTLSTRCMLSNVKEQNRAVDVLDELCCENTTYNTGWSRFWHLMTKTFTDFSKPPSHENDAENQDLIKQNKQNSPDVVSKSHENDIANEELIKQNKESSQNVMSTENKRKIHSFQDEQGQKYNKVGAASACKIHSLHDNENNKKRTVNSIFNENYSVSKKHKKRKCITSKKLTTSEDNPVATKYDKMTVKSKINLSNQKKSRIGTDWRKPKENILFGDQVVERCVETMCLTSDKNNETFSYFLVPEDHSNNDTKVPHNCDKWESSILPSGNHTNCMDNEENSGVSQCQKRHYKTKIPVFITRHSKNVIQDFCKVNMTGRCHQNEENFKKTKRKHEDEGTVRNHNVLVTESFINHDVLDTQSFINHNVLDTESFINHNVLDTESFRNNNVLDTESFRNHNVLDTESFINHMLDTESFRNHNVLDTESFRNHNVLDTEIISHNVLDTKSFNAVTGNTESDKEHAPACQTSQDKRCNIYQVENGGNIYPADSGGTASIYKEFSHREDTAESDDTLHKIGTAESQSKKYSSRTVRKTVSIKEDSDSIVRLLDKSAGVIEKLTVNTKTIPSDVDLRDYFQDLVTLNHSAPDIVTDLRQHASSIKEDTNSIVHLLNKPAAVIEKLTVNTKTTPSDVDLRDYFRDLVTLNHSAPVAVTDLRQHAQGFCRDDNSDLTGSELLQSSLECLLEMLLQRGKVTHAFITNIEGEIMAKTTGCCVTTNDTKSILFSLASSYSGMVKIAVFGDVYTCFKHDQDSLIGRATRGIFVARRGKQNIVVGFCDAVTPGSCIKEVQEISELLSHRGL